jgi:hypothetical protein
MSFRAVVCSISISEDNKLCKRKRKNMSCLFPISRVRFTHNEDKTNDWIKILYIPQNGTIRVLINVLCIFTDRAIDALFHGIKTKVLVLRTAEIWKIKTEHMESHLFYEHWLGVICASTLWRYDIAKISLFPTLPHCFIFCVKRYSVSFIPSSHGVTH